MCFFRHMYRMPNKFASKRARSRTIHASLWISHKPFLDGERSIIAAGVPYRISRVFPTRFSLDSAKQSCAVLHFSRHLRYPCAVQQQRGGRPEETKSGKRYMYGRPSTAITNNRSYSRTTPRLDRFLIASFHPHVQPSEGSYCTGSIHKV